MSKLELALLGHFECLLPSGTRVSLPMRKAEVLLAFLALSPGLRHPRERLINLLWSDRSDEQARNSLRQCLSAIRKALGEAADLALLVDRTTVSLKAGTIEVDALEFERLALESDFESLTTAADLYRGEFLEGISIRDAACQDWLESERSRFKRQLVEILSNVAETRLVSHDFAGAVRSAEHLVRQDPLGEHGWRLLMRAYADSGDRSHALQAYKRCQKVLRDELGVDPDSATAELRERISSSEQSPGPDTPLSPPQTANADELPGENSAPGVAETNDHSIAVLPFDNLSGDPEQEYFSDGITESIILNLALFPGLHVKSRNSSFAFKQQLKGLAEISRELDVDYIVEGSVRKSKDRIRITAQLIDAANGNQLWGKRYDADIDDLFDLEEELSRAIAATVTGRIKSELQRVAIAKGAADQQAYDLLLAGMYHVSRFNSADNAIAIERFERCLAQDPDNVRAHVGLHICYSMAYLGRWIENHENSYDRAWKYIRCALQLDPEDRAAQVFHGEMLALSGELDKARKQIDKVLTQNPNDTEALAVLAMIKTLSGDARGANKTAEHALELDPFHPWAEWELAVSHYYCGNYEGAVEAIATMRAAPGFITLYAVAALVRLERMEEARDTLRAFMLECETGMKEIPRTIDEWFEYTRQNYPYVDEQLNRDLVNSMVQAGLEEGLAQRQAEGREERLPTLLVLPFVNQSGDPEQEYFSDGITTSIVLGLGNFDGLLVKSQQTSFTYKQSSMSSEQIADELRVDYLVEGGIRKSANRIRISVQLIESASGNQLWGKHYDTELADVLELEQELSQTIAATISGRIGHELQQTAARKSARNLESHDHLLRGLYHFGKFNSRDFAIAKQEIQNCLEHDPVNAIAHSNLGMIHLVEFIEGWSSVRTQSKTLAGKHLQQAVDADPDSCLAHAYLAEYLYRVGDFESAEFHADRAIELNPTASESFTVKADLLGCSGRIEESLTCADLCLQLDPHSVGAAWSAGFVYQAAGQYEKAIKFYRSMSHPPASVQALTAACFTGLGLMDEACREMKRYQEISQKQMSAYPQDETAWREFWRDYFAFKHDKDFNRLFKQLLGAGLCENLANTSDGIPSIAVLPFENMSGDPEQEYFADGITADLVETLSRFRHLRTVSRYSTLPYKTDKPPIAEIAAQQQVRYILEGHVRKSGNRIRVSAELIDAQTDGIIWSQRFDRDLEDLFTVQDELTQDIALAMKVQLDDGEMARLRSKGTNDVRAWELIMTAVDLQDTYIRKNILDARRMAEQAIRLDPDYPYAWLCLGWTHWQEAYSGGSPSIEASIDAAEKANTKAHELDPDYAEVWSQRGMIHLMRHEADAAIADCLKAVELEPGSAEIQGLAAFAHIFAGQYETAKKYSQNMLRLSPIRQNWHYLTDSQIEVALGNLEKGAEIYRQGIAVEPESPLCRYFLIDLMVQLGDESAAQRYADEIRALDQSVSARGIVQFYSADPALRQALHDRLARFGLV